MTAMCVLQEATYERLLGRYERTFGEQPTLTVATLDEAIAFMRARLGFGPGHGGKTADRRAAASCMRQACADAPPSGPPA